MKAHLQQEEDEKKKTEESQKHSHELSLCLVGIFLRNSQKQNASKYKKKVF